MQPSHGFTSPPAVMAAAQSAVPTASLGDFNMDEKLPPKLSTKEVTKLELTDDLIVNRKKWEVYDATLRAALGEYARFLDSNSPPTVEQWCSTFSQLNDADSAGNFNAGLHGAAFLKHLERWRHRERLVKNAIVVTCDFSSPGCDTAGTYLRELLKIETAHGRWQYLHGLCMDVSTPARQEQLEKLFEQAVIIPSHPTRPSVSYALLSAFNNWLLLENNREDDPSRFVRHVYTRMARAGGDSRAYAGQLQANSRLAKQNGSTAAFELNITTFAEAVSSFYPEPDGSGGLAGLAHAAEGDKPNPKDVGAAALAAGGGSVLCTRCCVVGCTGCVVFGGMSIADLPTQGRRLFAEACIDFVKEKGLQKLTQPPSKDWLAAWRAKKGLGLVPKGVGLVARAV